jgi:four helix bundle protein
MGGLFKRIEDIEVWKRGCRLAVNIYKVTNQKPFEKDWSLKDQIRKAVISIPSNIAEGFERESFAEFKRFLLIAKGSCGELRTQLFITQALGYINKSDVEGLIAECVEISSMISGLIKHLKK